MRELLRHRDFRLLLTGQTLSMFGDWTLLLVFGIWAKTLTGSNALAGLMILAMAAPGLLAPIGGVLVDRLPRRNLMIALDLASVVVVSSLWLVEGRAQLWILFAVAFWSGLSGVVFNAAMAGFVQALLPHDLVGPANGALATVRQGLRLVGPLIGAGLFAAFGGHWVAALDATTFLLSAGAMVLLRHRETRAVRAASTLRTELAAGLVHLWRTPMLRPLIFTTVLWSISFGVLEPVVYALVGDGLHRPPEFVGVLVSVQGVGAILGGIAVTVAVRRVAELPLVIVGLFLIAAGCALATVPSLPVVLVGFALIGTGLPTVTVAAATLLQHWTPNAVMGRVAAGYDVIGTVPTIASIALGAVLVGVLPYPVIITGAAVGAAVAAVFLLGSRRAWRTAPADVDTEARKERITTVTR